MDLDQTQEINIKDTLEEQRKAQAEAAPSENAEPAAPAEQKVQKKKTSGSGSRSGSGSKSGTGTHKKRRLTKKAIERRKRRRRKRIFHLVLILVLIIALAVVIGKLFSKKKADDETASTLPEKLTEADFTFSLSSDRQTIGTAQTLEELADYQGYRLRYPAIGNTVIDDQIAQRANDIVSVFKSEVKQLYQEGMIMTLCGDYAISESDTYVSVMFDYNVVLPEQDLSGEKMETYSYNLTTGEDTGLSSVLKKGYLDFLESKLQEYADTLEGTQIGSNIAAEDKCFKNFMWTNEGLTLYFLPGTIIENGTDTLSFTIPMSELTDYLITEE